jgi:hypothetical protein
VPTRTSAALFDHLIGTQQDGRWQFDANCLRRFEIHDGLEFGCPFKRQVSRRRALYDLVDERRSAVVEVIPCYGARKPPIEFGEHRGDRR